MPTGEQFAADAAVGLPGGFTALRDSGGSRVEVVVDGDVVCFSLDGAMPVERRVGKLAIDRPVVWPGSFESSPTITAKPRHSSDQGPAVSCGPDEACLLLARASHPTGSYEAVVEPGRTGRVELIQVTRQRVDPVLTNGDRVDIDRADESFTDACGIAETPLWEIPAGAGLDHDQPVLVHTVCPSDPGVAIQMVIIERAAIPILVPTVGTGDSSSASVEWCSSSPTCLWFAPT